MHIQEAISPIAIAAHCDISESAPMYRVKGSIPLATHAVGCAFKTKGRPLDARIDCISARGEVKLLETHAPGCGPQILLGVKY